jgi:hypothetical protein
MYGHILLTEDLFQYANQKEEEEMKSAYVKIFWTVPAIYMRGNGHTLIEDYDDNSNVNGSDKSNDNNKTE